VTLFEDPVTPASLFDKVWYSHVVTDLGDDLALLHVDRHFLHDLNGMKVLAELRERGYTVRNADLTVATADHALSTRPDRTEDSNPAAVSMLRGLRAEAARAGIRYFGIDRSEQGIVHIMGPEQGLTQPGISIVCGDSHTCTQGALGALAFGVGRSEVMHVLATQTLYQKKPKLMRVRFDGTPPPGVAPKDLVLHLIGKIGADGGSGHAVEYGGTAIQSMSIEGRMTVCNLSIELGAKFGMVAPDDTTFSYLSGRPFAPKDALWDQALTWWRSLKSDSEAQFDREVSIDSRLVAPQVTWGTSPQQVLGIDERVPDPADEPLADKRRAMEEALAYMGLQPRQALEGLPIDWVFIGSCTNGRIEDLRAAAQVLGDRKVAAGVHAWVVPGSQEVRRQAEAEGLDKQFLAAGFEWRAPGCSMCLAANGETVPPGQRSISTTNRNFEGRQGPLARTHLASPAMAAAAALTGRITDLRKLMN
jgi:3-isopropylmalate/(R)-2-methylmalate dehydratase large subunit